MPKIEIDINDPKLIDNMCLSYRHDFGLMSEEDKDNLRFECKEWLRSLVNNTSIREEVSIKELKAVIEAKKYKKAYNALICYFDSISDEEQIKVEKKLKKIFDE